MGDGSGDGAVAIGILLVFAVAGRAELMGSIWLVVIVVAHLVALARGRSKAATEGPTSD